MQNQLTLFKHKTKTSV